MIEEIDATAHLDTQPSSFDPQPASQLPAVRAPNETRERTALADLRENAMSVSVERMQQGLTEYADRRRAFRDWLLAQMKEGTHYGYSPGCAPKWCDANGKLCAEKDAWGTKGKTDVPLSQWRPKPGLYKAGADFVCDLLGAIDMYEADGEGWVQAGSNAGTFVYICYLKSRTNGSLIGEGRGIGRTGDEQLGANAAIKKAKKRAKVDAVLNGYGLSDLFTQDTEDPDKSKTVAPPASNPNAKSAKPRDERVTKEELKTQIDRWKREFPNACSKNDWLDYVRCALDREFPEAAVASSWSREEFEILCKAISNSLTDTVPF